MMSKRRWTLALLMGIVFAASCAQAPQTAPVPDGVFVHITRGADDPHRLLMALSMAAKMAEDRDVLVYFDISAVNVLLQDAQDVSFAHFPSAHTQIAALAAQQVPLMACPGCLAVIGKTAADLRTGVVEADKDAFFAFTEGRILTLDY